LPVARARPEDQMLLPRDRDDRDPWSTEQRLGHLGLLRLRERQPSAVSRHHVRVVPHPLRLVLAGPLLQRDRMVIDAEEAGATDDRARPDQIEVDEGVLDPPRPGQALALRATEPA